MYTTHLCNNLQLCILKRLENLEIILKKSLGAIKPKGINRIAKVSYSNLCLQEDYLSITSVVCLFKAYILIL